MLVEDLDALLGRLAPLELAEPWDTTGLLVGRSGSVVERVLVALELTEEVLVEARTGGYQAIVTHHPLLFRPLDRVTDRDPRGLLVAQLVNADIALFACHTNLDAAPGGLADLFADELGLADTRPLRRSPRDWMKLVTFMPPDALARVSKAVFGAGAGTIGDYTGCAFTAEGQGHFTPGARAHPTVGRRTEEIGVPEVRFETVVPRRGVRAAVEALIGAHPYEEPLVDLYPVADVRLSGGLGRVGATRASVPLLSIAQAVADLLGLPEMWYAGSPAQVVNRVAVVPGSGSDLLEDAGAAADVLVTGDLRYHDAERAAAMGLSLVWAPHGELEAWALRRWTEVLTGELERSGVVTAFSQSGRPAWRRVRAMPDTPGKAARLRLFEAGEMDAEATPPIDAVAPGEDDLYRLRIDGGSRGNPGPSAIGVILEDADGVVLEELGEEVGFTTNNVAEYQALITGLETALDRGVRRVEVLSDSELLVRQLREEYRVRDQELKELVLQVRSLARQFRSVEISHVRREDNAAADALVNRVLDERSRGSRKP